jgi:hypothetical protein
MRRVFFTAVASSALALAVSGVASAQHGKRHHWHRASSHKRHHRHAHIVRFGTLAASTPSSSASSPATPSSPAGTVASFTGGVLTIMLADKSTVSGKVTEQTELECQSPAPTASASSHDGGDDGDRHDSSGSTSSQQAGSQSGDDEQGDDQDDDQGDDEQGAQQSCTTAALETGAVVQEAELSISSAGAVWHKVELG